MMALAHTLNREHDLALAAIETQEWDKAARNLIAASQNAGETVAVEWSQHLENALLSHQHLNFDHRRIDCVFAIIGANWAVSLWY